MKLTIARKKMYTAISRIALHIRLSCIRFFLARARLVRLGGAIAPFKLFVPAITAVCKVTQPLNTYRIVYGVTLVDFAMQGQLQRRIALPPLGRDCTAAIRGRLHYRH